jgi:hypothetical protein
MTKRSPDHCYGMTLMELILAVSISIFILELVFYVYMVLFHSFDIGFLQSKAEDEARHAVQRISREIRSAKKQPILTNQNSITFVTVNGIANVLYLYKPEMNYSEYQTGIYPSTPNVVLKLLAAGNITAGNYGEGAVVAKGLLPPPATRFQSTLHGGVDIQVCTRLQDSGITLNTTVYPRSTP